MFIAWYFSLCIVTILPNDISATFYRQCKQQIAPVSTLPPTHPTTSPTDDNAPLANVTIPIPNPPQIPAGLPDDAPEFPDQYRKRRELDPEYVKNIADCIPPSSLVHSNIIPVRVRKEKKN